MLFDLEDYRTSGFFSPSWENIMDLIDNGVTNQWGDTVNGGDFEDPATTARATRDAFFKSVNEYRHASRVANFENLGLIDSWLHEWNDAIIDLGFSWKTFWDAYVSIPYLGGRRGGEAAFIENHGGDGREFTIMTQEIYDEYYTKMTAIMQLVKELFELGEGNPIIE